MSFSESRPYLICYDIADPARLRRVHRFLRRHAYPLQYSVFVALMPEWRLVGLLADLAHYIDRRYDDVRAYPVPLRADAVLLGRSELPPGVLLVDARLSPLLPGSHCDKETYHVECDREEET